MRAIEHKKCRSNSGHVGIHVTRIRGRNCYSVSWRPAKGVRKATTIYFDEETQADALKRATALRKAAIAARYAREKATTKTP